MNMIQLILGAAAGFIVGEGVLYGAKRFVNWLPSIVARKRKLGALRTSSLIGGLVKYGSALAAVAAFITFAFWIVGDYVAEPPAVSMANVQGSDPSAGVSLSDPDEVVGVSPAMRVNPSVKVKANNTDPYTDSAFKVRRQPHQAGVPLSLKETLVRRSEARARADLVRQTQEHLHRSQYDCEAAERATKYLNAGLDVWGFATWQLKYFPVDRYKGATLPQCKDIKNVVDPKDNIRNVVDPSKMEVRSTDTTENHT